MNIKKKISMILTLLMVITTVLPSNIVKAEKSHLSTDKVILFEGQPYIRPSGSCEIAGDGGSVVFGGYTSLKEVNKYWDQEILVAYSDNWNIGKEFLNPIYGKNYGETNLQGGFPERKVTIGNLTTYMGHKKEWLMENVVIIPTLNVERNSVVGYKGGKVEYWGLGKDSYGHNKVCLGVRKGILNKIGGNILPSFFSNYNPKTVYVSEKYKTDILKAVRTSKTAPQAWKILNMSEILPKKKCPTGSTFEGKEINSDANIEKECYLYCPTTSHKNKGQKVPKGQTIEGYCYYNCSDYNKLNFTDTAWDNSKKTFTTSYPQERLLNEYVSNGKLKTDNLTLSRAYHFCNIHYCPNPDGTPNKEKIIPRQNRNGHDTRKIGGIKDYIKNYCPNYCPNNTLSYVDKANQGAIEISKNATKEDIDDKCNVINCVNTSNNKISKLSNKKIPEITELQDEIQNLKKLNKEERDKKRIEILKQVKKIKDKYCKFCPVSDIRYQIDNSKSGKLREIVETNENGDKKYKQVSEDDCYKTCPLESKFKIAKDKNGKSLAGAKIPVNETENLYCYANCPVKPSSQETTQGYVLKKGMENKPIPSNKTRLEYCMTKKDDKCPISLPKEMSKEGYILINAGKTIPKGKQIDSYCYKKQVKCPTKIPTEKDKDYTLINSGKIVPQGKTIDNYCYKPKDKSITQYCLDKNGQEIKNKPLRKNGKEVKYTPKELKSAKIQKEIEKLRKELTEKEYCPKIKTLKKCPNNTRRKGENIPKGKSVYWCDNHCPPTAVNANAIIPVGQSESEFCKLPDPPRINCEYGSGLLYIKNRTESIGTDSVEGIHTIYAEIVPVKPQNFDSLSQEEQNYWYQTHKKNITEPIITEYGQFIDEHTDEIRELYKYVQRGGTGASSNYKKKWNWIVSEARRLRDKVNANPPKPSLSFSDDDTSLGNERGGVYTFTEYRKNAKISSTHYQDYYDMYHCETFYITRWYCWSGENPGCTTWEEPHNRYAYHSGNHIIDGEYNTGDSSVVIDSQYKPAYSYQSITVRCNKQGLESVINSYGGTLIKSGYISGTGRSQIVYGKIASFFDFLPLSFFYKDFGNGGSCEYVFGCTGKGNTNASGLNDSSNNKGNTYKTDNNLFGAQAYEHGKENDDTYAKGSSKFTFFRDNQPNKIRNDVWWLDKKINTNEADLDEGSEALATFWTLDVNGTPKKDFFRLEDSNHNLITDGNGLQSKWAWVTLSQQNVFYWRSKWASENGKPHKMNIKYAYKPEITTQNPDEYTRDGFTTREDKSAIDMICEVRFNTNKVYKPLIHNLPKEFEYKPFNNFDFTKSKVLEVNFVKSSKE